MVPWLWDGPFPPYRDMDRLRPLLILLLAIGPFAAESAFANTSEVPS